MSGALRRTVQAGSRLESTEEYPPRPPCPPSCREIKAVRKKEARRPGVNRAGSVAKASDVAETC